ncbi:MAG: chemotaxis response regulator protein-glutamate methylesterase [Leptospirales bacterium]|nr:chemotaxis response regulator protein-glutamate methylesterase [Leptospirales bacterium]
MSLRNGTLAGRKVRVLVVDDQSTVRAILQQGLSEDSDIEIVGWASNAYSARDRIVQLSPDVVTLDVEMPRMSGLEFLKKLMPQYPLPVVMVSSFTGAGQAATLEALEAGAVDFVCKPDGSAGQIHTMLDELRNKVKIAARVDREKLRKKFALPVSAPNVTVARAPVREKPTTGTIDSITRVIAVGASTGGTTALRELLAGLTPDLPGMVVVQHMPAGFTAMFASNLNKTCPFEVREARSGDQVLPGQVLIAPGDLHLTLQKKDNAYYVSISMDEKVSGHRPSVDVLFNSVADEAGEEAIGILLTGMGADGARGLLRMRANGSRTIGQDEESSVVYGMPKVAYSLGAVEFQKSLLDIPKAVIELVQNNKARRKTENKYETTPR